MSEDLVIDIFPVANVDDHNQNLTVINFEKDAKIADTQFSQPTPIYECCSIMVGIFKNTVYFSIDLFCRFFVKFFEEMHGVGGEKNCIQMQSHSSIASII